MSKLKQVEQKQMWKVCMHVVMLWIQNGDKQSQQLVQDAWLHWRQSDGWQGRKNEIFCFVFESDTTKVHIHTYM